MFQSYQLTPVNLRPPPRPSRKLHGIYQQKIDQCVEVLMGEKEVVDSSNEIAKELLLTMDAVLSHGLNQNDKCYWRYVREFLPKREQQLLEVEWAKSSRRVLSFAWLKDSFNRSSLHFQLLAFLDARAITRRFYQETACLRNFGIFELIVFNIGKLDKVQFAFDRAPSNNGIPLAYELPSPSTISMTSIPDQSLLAGCSHANGDNGIYEETEKTPRPVDALPPASSAAQVKLISSSLDQDLLLNDLVRERRTRLMNGYMHSVNSEVVEDELEECADMELNNEEEEVERKEQRLDDVLSKTISQVRLEHLDTEPKSFESLLLLDQKQTSGSLVGGQSSTHTVVHYEEDVVDGEITLHSGEVLRFAMDVFVDVEEGEKFQKLFHVYDGAPSMEKARLLLVTDRNLYLMTQQVADGVGPSGAALPANELTVDYTVHITMPLPVIEYIEMCQEGLILVFYAAQGKAFSTDASAGNNRIIGVVTAEQSLGRSIVDTIVFACESIGTKAPAIYDSQSPFNFIIKRFLRDLSLPGADLSFLSVVFWVETPYTIKEEQQIEPAYFIRREIARSWFASSTSDWQQSYFVLKDCKLYIFTDSTCDVGERIIDLRCTPDGEPAAHLSETENAEHPNIVCLRGIDYNFEISFPSVDEKHKWLYALQNASCQASDIALSSSLLLFTDSHMVVGQLGTNCYVDGFIRTLIQYKLEQLRVCLVLKTESRRVLLVAAENQFEWFFPRTDAECTRIRSHLAKFVPVHELPDCPPSMDQNLPKIIEAQAKLYRDIWAVKAFVTGSDALSDIEDND